MFIYFHSSVVQLKYTLCVSKYSFHFIYQTHLSIVSDESRAYTENILPVSYIFIFLDGQMGRAARSFYILEYRAQFHQRSSMYSFSACRSKSVENTFKSLVSFYSFEIYGCKSCTQNTLMKLTPGFHWFAIDRFYILNQ